jgi:hypothetical protein
MYSIPQLPEQFIKIYVYGYGATYKNSAFGVRFDYSLYEFYKNIAVPHITVSIGSGGKPVDSGNLYFTPLEEAKHFELRGKFFVRYFEGEKDNVKN